MFDFRETFSFHEQASQICRETVLKTRKTVVIRVVKLS